MSGTKIKNKLFCEKYYVNQKSKKSLKIHFKGSKWRFEPFLSIFIILLR